MSILNMSNHTDPGIRFSFQNVMWLHEKVWKLYSSEMYANLNEFIHFGTYCAGIRYKNSKWASLATDRFLSTNFLRRCSEAQNKRTIMKWANPYSTEKCPLTYNKTSNNMEWTFRFVFVDTNKCTTDNNWIVIHSDLWKILIRKQYILTDSLNTGYYKI